MHKGVHRPLSRYLISFLDDYTSNAWVILLRRKDDALNTTKDFAALVETQYKTNIQEWMSDAGESISLKNLTTFSSLKELRSYRVFHTSLNKMVVLNGLTVLLWIKLRLCALQHAYLKIGGSSL